MTDLFANRYQLERRLGVGGMSTVQLAFDTRLERYVAVKLLAEHLAEDQNFVSRFRREALAAARLVHPNIVQVFDFGLDDPSGRHYIVMEYVEGQSMAEVLRAEGRIPPPEAVRVLEQSCRGLEYAHRHGVIHRDVKPGNLLRSNDGQVKLADFGIAKAAEQSDITKTGSVIGTAAYLAPEQARGEPAGPGADIYALGVVAYQLMAGHLPYQAPSLTELARMQEAGLPPALDELVPEVPPALSEVVDRTLAPTPQERFPDAMAFASALNDGLAGIAPPDTGEQTQATQMVAADDTERTRAMPRTARETVVAPAPVPPPRRRMEPLADDFAPPPRQPVRRGAEPLADPGRRRRSAASRRALRSMLILLVLAAVAIGVVLFISGDSGSALQLKENVRGGVDQATQDLIDLINDNTQ